MSRLHININDELYANRQAFLRFNHFKINKTIETLSKVDRLVFIVIPRLVHVHQKGLPGYIEDDVPSGVFNFTINTQTRLASEILFPHLTIRPRENTQPFIETVLLMGSTGSIAQTRKSDLDYTLLIHKGSITERGKELLNRKLQMIEKWAWNHYELEIHFFINEIEDFKKNIYGESDSERTGSALAKLLKEEMYRTSVLAAGKIPLWWIVPVETDDDQYEQIRRQINSRETLLNPDEFIDMGNVDEISQEEFFGGSIWTLIKSFQSPFKTLMKMGLMEEYMFHDAKSNLLCHEIKRKLLNGILHEAIDPYITMFERVETYFKKEKSENEVDALRIAFYLKVGTQVNAHEMEYGVMDPKKATLINLIRSWGWSSHKLGHLNGYSHWQMMEKVTLGERMNRILINCYKKISDKGKSLETGDNLISQKDTHLLGRKLYSFYRKTSHKVDNLFCLVDGPTSEKELTFLHDQKDSKDKGAWYLIQGKTLKYLEQIPKENIIKKSSTPMLLIASAAFNHLYNKDTTLLLRSQNHSIRGQDLRNLLDQLSSFMTRVNIADLSNEELVERARIKQLFLVADFGYPLHRDLVTEHNYFIEDPEETRERNEKNLEFAQAFTSIFRTSWGELFSKTYSGPGCVDRCLDELSARPNDLDDGPNSLKVYIIGSRKENLEFPWLNSHIIDYLGLKDQLLFTGQKPEKEN